MFLGRMYNSSGPLAVYSKGDSKMRRRGLLIVCLFMADSFAACDVDKKNQEVPVDTVETGDGFSCDPGKEPGEDLEEEPGEAPGEDPGQEPEQDPGQEASEPAKVLERGDCKSCTGDDDCNEGFKCLSLASEDKYCLRPCEEHKDCLPGYQCFQASSVLKACVPNTYNCVPCAFDAPCGEGMCCDFNNGQCKECRQQCDQCIYDSDCAGDMRCFKKAGSPVGVCVEECEKQECSDTTNFTCSPSFNNIQVCQPNDVYCGGCPDGTFPLPDGTGCVECLDSSHCDDGVCDLITYTCDYSECPSHLHMCDDGQCHTCCEDAHCVCEGGGTGICRSNFECECCSTCDDSDCRDPYPVCAKVDGVEMCVQCKEDADCHRINEACICTPVYACEFSDHTACTK
jgi:hypothetical protein